MPEQARPYRIALRFNGEPVGEWIPAGIVEALAPDEIDTEASVTERSETVLGVAYRDIAEGEEVKIAFDMVTAVEEDAAIGPPLTASDS